MSLENKVNNVKLPKEQHILHKFILVNVKGSDYLRISEDHYENIQHKDMLNSLMKDLNLELDLDSKNPAGKDYSILSMGICKLMFKNKRCSFFGQSYWYNVGLTKEGHEKIKKMLPDWEINGLYQ